MLVAILGFIQRSWASIAFYISRMRHYLFPGQASPKRITTTHHDPDFPPTDKQRYAARDRFIESLCPRKIEALASSYKDNMTCRVLGHKNGSFNVCYFVEFNDATKWVVRIPLEPSLYQPWEKLQSEVATVRYLERSTTIPVPHIHAFGHGVTLTQDNSSTQMFLISDFVSGEPVDITRLKSVCKDRELSAHFFHQLIRILAELRAQEFPAIGSLMPGTDSAEPIVGSLLSVSANHMRIGLPKFNTASAYIKCHLDIIRDQSRSTNVDYDEDEIRDDFFALSSLLEYFDKLIPPEQENGPFVLSHTDLRPDNIIIDEHLNIKAIIDWEFAAVIPRQVSVPPPWATGCDPHPYTYLFTSNFRDGVYQAAWKEKAFEVLKSEWYKPHNARLAYLLRYPAHFFTAFYDKDYFTGPAIAEELHGEDLDAAIIDFFERNVELAAEAKQIAAKNQRYTEYLKQNNSYEQG